tara:strand:- start:863 stop:1090 length:228 start_codon:yes stop_codon:yes gene_type:complete
MKNPTFLPVGKDYYDPQNLVNHEHIRNALIRAFNDGLLHSDLTARQRLTIIQDNFFIGESQIKKVLSHNERKRQS